MIFAEEGLLVRECPAICIEGLRGVVQKIKNSGALRIEKWGLEGGHKLFYS